MDRWVAAPIQCQGGLVLDMDTLSQGKDMPGSAKVLINFEPSIDGGYKRLLGYSKWSSDAVTGDLNAPITGVTVALGGVFATRYSTSATSNDIYYSSGSSWTKINSSSRPGTVRKTRGHAYSITKPVVVFVDGVNYAAKWDGTTYTVINGVGAPTNPSVACLWRNRLVLSGYTANTSAVSISAPNADTDFTGGAGAIEINVGDTVVGLVTFRDELVIFCKTSIKKLTGTVSSGLTVTEVSKSIGCLSSDSIQEIAGDIIFAAPDGFRSLAATDRIGDVDFGLLSKQIQPKVRDIITSSLEDWRFSSCIIRRKNQYRLFLNDSSFGESDSTGFLGFVGGNRSTLSGVPFEWSTILGIKPYCSDSSVIGSAEIAVIGHPTNGYVYQLENGNSFDGRSISAQFTTPDIIFDDYTLRKVFHKIDVFTSAEGDFSVSMRLYLDGFGSSAPQPTAISLDYASLGATYGTAVYGTSVYGLITNPVFKKNLVGSGFTGSFTFSSADTNPPYTIDSFVIQLAIKGRR